MIFDRTIVSQIRESILNQTQRGIVLYGPRQAGKTTLLQSLIPESDSTIWFTGDDIRAQEKFGTPRLDILSQTVGTASCVVIDEAQRIENIGLSVKLLIDQLHVRVILSGSSSFDLANKIAEPLTGRITQFFLYPLSISEIPQDSLSPVSQRLDALLRYGMYPAVQVQVGEKEKERIVYDLINTYLYKDVLMVEGVRKPKKILDLLSLLALQVGSEVSIAELCSRLVLSRPVVEKYLDLLEKMYIIVHIRGLSRNARKEIYKTSKYYFYDTGIRNGIIQSFAPIRLRDDGGALFENFCIMERIKHIQNNRRHAGYYFWRTWDQKEIDLVEDKNGQLTAFEFKWSDSKGISKVTKDVFSKLYPGSAIHIVSPESIDTLLTVV